MDTVALTLNQRKVLALFDGYPQLTVSLVCKKLALLRPTAKQVLMRLVNIGYLEQQGVRRGSFYVLKNEAALTDEFGNEAVRVYKGPAAFRRFFEGLQTELKKGDGYWSFAFKNEYYQSDLAEFLLNYHHELTRNGVDDRTIVHQDVAAVIRKTYRNVPDLKIRVTNQEVPIGMSILKDRVANLIWGDKPLIIVISAPEVVQRYRDFFVSAWDKAGPIART